jgi:3-oxoacyl-[acyl-carrier-protein] synthase-3
MASRSRIVGCGSYLPDRIMTNDELAEIVDTSDEWIVDRTGIKERRIAARNETTSDLAFHASQRALERAGLKASDLDLIVLATSTPDRTFPATATRVQAMLGMTNGAAFDVQAVCSGFVYALSVADSFVKTGQVKNALVIGAETFSRILDWTDRSTCVLFGDGAGAVVVTEANGAADPKGRPRAILSTHVHSDGALNDILWTDGGPSLNGSVGQVRMEGREVFRHAIANLTEVVDEALAANGLQRGDIDWLVPHQANKRILDGTARRLNLPADRIVVTLDRHANTSAASIPLALDEAVGDGRVKEGDLVLMEAMGAGLTWGACLARW